MQALYKAGLTGCVKGVKPTWSKALRLFAHDAKGKWHSIPADDVAELSLSAAMGTRAEGGMAFVEIERVQWRVVLASRAAVKLQLTRKASWLRVTMADVTNSEKGVEKQAPQSQAQALLRRRFGSQGNHSW
ncbi:TPA: hypothetical protein ACH3X1_013246 [Trebouxia sp. C0004]